jgi:hypothetical protein
MRVSFKKKSGWAKALDPIASKVKGRTLRVNGKPLTAEMAARPAARAIVVLAIATAASAIVSAMRGRGDQ